MCNGKKVVRDHDEAAATAPAAAPAAAASTACRLDTCTGLEAISISAKLFAVTMSFLSGFLGGLCGISGPPIMMFFLHAGHFDLVFTKASQRATGAAITFCNRAMRVLFYAVASADGSSSHYFDGDDYPMYISIAFCSFAGVWLGQNLFERMKDSQATIKAFSPNPDPVFPTPYFDPGPDRNPITL